MSIYFDNAATTPLDPEVFDAMKPFFMEDFGNPSSTHSHGRKAKAAIESCRKKIAGLLNCTPGEIIFTSGGTEADNAILTGAVRTYAIQTIITSRLEHHAVRHTLDHLAQHNNLLIRYVDVNDRGVVDINHLEELLTNNPQSLVSLMHGNNEIGNLLDIREVGVLCRKSGAYFHSDTVQTVGHYRHDLNDIHIDGMAAAAHKFHGPKGSGFMFIRKDKKISPYILGGSQERGVRGGTENVAGIVGLAKAMEIAYREMDEHAAYIVSLKKRMIDKITERIADVRFNGNSAETEKSLYTVLNVSLPESEENDMLLFNLDLSGISASGGSACSSGAVTGSHVLAVLDPGSKRGAVRFSFSKFNTADEVDFVVARIVELYGESARPIPSSQDR